MKETLKEPKTIFNGFNGFLLIIKGKACFRSRKSFYTWTDSREKENTTTPVMVNAAGSLRPRSVTSKFHTIFKNRVDSTSKQYRIGRELLDVQQNILWIYIKHSIRCCQKQKLNFPFYCVHPVVESVFQIIIINLFLSLIQFAYLCFRAIHNISTYLPTNRCSLITETKVVQQLVQKVFSPAKYWDSLQFLRK